VAEVLHTGTRDQVNTGPAMGALNVYTLSVPEDTNRPPVEPRIVRGMVIVIDPDVHPDKSP